MQETTDYASDYNVMGLWEGQFNITNEEIANYGFNVDDGLAGNDVTGSLEGSSIAEDKIAEGESTNSEIVKDLGESGGLKPEDLILLFEGICTLNFRFEDGSVIQCISSLNEDVLRMHGLGSIDALLDLEERRPIPEYLLEKLTHITKGSTKQLSPLDLFLEVGGKVGW